MTRFKNQYIKVITEEKLDTHNITSDEQNVFVDTLSQTSNIQTENTNAVLTSGNIDKLDALAETLKYLKINDVEYYVSES